MSTEPEHLVLQLLRDLCAEMGDMRAEMATKADLRSEIHALRADVASDFIETRREIAGVRKDLGEQVVGLRRAVVDYHTSVIGRGVVISKLEARLRRVEQHLDLPPLDAHRGTNSADLPCRRVGIPGEMRALRPRRGSSGPIRIGHRPAVGDGSTGPMKPAVPGWQWRPGCGRQRPLPIHLRHGMNVAGWPESVLLSCGATRS